MKVYTTREEIDEIGEFMVMKYNFESYLRCEAFDIEGFIKNSLHYSIVYDTFGEEDASKLAFLADGITALRVKRNGNIVEIVPPAKTIVLDKYLNTKGLEKKKRFNLAHEAGHIVINLLYGKEDIAAYNREFDKERKYDIKELQSMFHISESQATSMGVAMLMPRKMIVGALKELTGKTSISLYGDQILTNEDKNFIYRFADKLNVSYKSMFYRFKSLNLFEYRTIEEYISKQLGRIEG